MTFLEFLIYCLLVGASAFLSSSEVALFSLSRFQVKRFRDHLPLVYEKIRKMLNDSGGLLLTVLVANEFINISIATLVARAVSRGWEKIYSNLTRYFSPDILSSIPEWSLQTVVGLVITAPIILILCEMVPKVVAARMNRVIALMTVNRLFFIYRIFKPVRKALEYVGSALQSKEQNVDRLKEDEFLMILEEGHQEGEIDQAEVGMIKNIFKLDDVRVSRILTPLSRVTAFSAQTTVSEALRSIEKRRHYRVPVYEGTKKNIVGILYTKDLMFSKLDPETLSSTVGTLMRKPFFIQSDMYISTLFKRMKQYKKHLVIVLNQKNEAIGISTMTDLLTAIFHELVPDQTEPKKAKE